MKRTLKQRAARVAAVLGISAGLAFGGSTVVQLVTPDTADAATRVACSTHYYSSYQGNGIWWSGYYAQVTIRADWWDLLVGRPQFWTEYYYGQTC